MVISLCRKVISCKTLWKNYKKLKLYNCGNLTFCHLSISKNKGLEVEKCGISIFENLGLKWTKW